MSFNFATLVSLSPHIRLDIRLCHRWPSSATVSFETMAGSTDTASGGVDSPAPSPVIMSRCEHEQVTWRPFTLQSRTHPMAVKLKTGDHHQ